MRVAREYLRRGVKKRPPLPLTGFDPRGRRRVLIINSTALGDFLFSTPAIRALKETYPDWRLDLLAPADLAGLAALNPHLASVIPFPGQKWRLLGLMGELKRGRYDLAIILHGNDPEATLLAWATGSPYLIGSGGSPLSFAYAAQVPRGDLFEHAIERRLNFVRLLNADTEDKGMELFLPPGELVKAEALLTGHFGAKPPLLAAFHPTGSGPYKWWPRQSFAALGNYLQEAYGASFLIISGREDRRQAEALAAMIKAPALVTGGRVSLTTAAALLNRCRLFVGGDSGPLHMALALKVPSVALLGADHPRRVGPYQVDWGVSLYRKEGVCSREPCLSRACPDNVCLQAIRVEEAAGLIRSWWEPRFLGEGGKGEKVKRGKGKDHLL